MENRKKRALIVGMARSGIAAAKLLISLGARVTITDTKPEGEFGGALDELRTPECTFALGQSADGLIAGQDIMVISPGIAWAKPFVQNAIAQGVEVMGELELGARLTKGALVAITGAMLLLILHIMPFETAIGHIDFNTLGVLFMTES